MPERGPSQDKLGARHPHGTFPSVLYVARLTRWTSAAVFCGSIALLSSGACGGGDSTTASDTSGGSAGMDASAGTGAGEGGTGGAQGGAGGSAGSTASGGVAGSGGSAGALTGGTGTVGGAAGSGGVGGSAGAAGSGGVGGTAGMDAGMDGGDADPPDVACTGEQKRCNGMCVDIDDPAFGCGQMGCDPCSIPGAVAACENNACVFAGCATGFADCNNDLADLCETEVGTDANNCGACGNACVVNHGTAGCQNSQCTVESCDTDWGDCDGDPTNGCESFLPTDPENCAGCGNVCDPASSGQPVCNDGTCSEKACLSFLSDCNNDSSDGCEAFISADVNNCGYCGRVCELPNAVATCSQSECAIESCIAPFEDCDGIAGNGCETDTTKDNALHCGACGRACSLAQASSAVCIAGVCGAVCDSGFGDCSQPTAPDPDDGCELDVRGDPQNCGSCGFVCTLQDAVAGCADSQCVVDSCTGNTADCDGDFSNGCETDLDTSIDHCGECGRACSNDGVVTRSCTGGLCDSICDPSFGNCGQPAAPLADDGCETDLTSDPLNCGGCQRRCASDNVVSLACENKRCTSTCQLGFANCFQPTEFNADDGCELDVTADNNNCGGCGNDCTQQGSAAGSLLCGFVEPNQCGCVGNAGRCRVDSGTNPECPVATGLCVCGGVECRPGEACVAGGSGDECSCEGGAGCGAGEFCCQQAAGCIDVSTNPAHCGACDRACPTDFDCTNGVCGCANDPSCDAGSAGTCSAGICECGGVPCGAGQRCLADGSCG